MESSESGSERSGYGAGSKIVIAHLSDPHLPLPTKPRFGELISKRAFGYANWLRKRQFIHRKDVLDLLVTDVQAHNPDQILVGGDLVNLALPEEFDAARQWLEALGDPARVVVVPGNHDTYVPLDWRKGLGKLAPFLGGSEQTGPVRFPTVRQVGPVRIIGLDSAPSTMPGLASGRVDKGQLQRLAALLEQAPNAQDETFTIVMLHHPVVPGLVGWHKALRDGDALIAVLEAGQVDLVVHGHAHLPIYRRLGKSKIAHIGVASASYCAPMVDHKVGKRRAAGQYHLFSIVKTSTGFEVGLTVRAVDPDRGEVETVHEWTDHQWPPEFG